MALKLGSFLDHSSPRNGVTEGRAHNDKREAILQAALRLIARDGLLSVPTSKISRVAGVATGTVFVYFKTKEDLLNELYLELVEQSIEVITEGLEAAASPEERFRSYWFNLARWSIDFSDASRVLLQLEVSSVLTKQTLARKDEMDVKMMQTYFPEALEELEGSLSRYALWAMLAGPIQVLVQMRDKGEIEITDALLEQTFRRVEKAVQL